MQKKTIIQLFLQKISDKNYKHYSSTEWRNIWLRDSHTSIQLMCHLFPRISCEIVLAGHINNIRFFGTVFNL